MHDLVRIDTSFSFLESDAPAWVTRRLPWSSWAVVRRESVAGCVAVGFRGRTRAQRHAAAISPSDIVEVVTPWQLDLDECKNERLRNVFSAVMDAANVSALHIAPVGSFGFELGCREQVTHAASDLDLIVDVTGAGREQLASFRSAIDEISAESGVHIDAELAFQQGGVALREALSGAASVLYKSSTGPILLPCPI